MVDDAAKVLPDIADDPVDDSTTTTTTTTNVV